MIKSPLELRRWAHCGNRQFFGGDSSSSQETKNIDGRVVGGDQSSNVSIAGNSGPVSVVATDHGAVSKSLDLALKGLEGAQTIAREAQADSTDLLAGVFKETAARQSQLTQAVVDLKTSDVRTLVIAGVAVVGLVAVQLFKKG